MSVTFGSPLTSANTNDAFVSRTQDTDMVGKLDNKNVTEATNQSTGAIHTDGGISAEKNIHGEDLYSHAHAGNKALVSGADKKVTESTVTATELEFVAGVTSSIQTQINAKADDSSVVHKTGNETIAGEKTFTNNAEFDGNVVIDGNLTVNGTSTTVNSATLDVVDQNVTVNFNGNDATGEGAGLTVDRTGTSGSLIYQDSLSSKFKAGALGSESELIVAAGTQTMTGDKTLTKAIVSSELRLSETVDSTTTGANAIVSLLSPTIRLTNASLTSVNNFDDAAFGKMAVITNGTGSPISLINDAGGTAIKRILTGIGANLVLQNEASIIISYDSNKSRWVVVGGSGGSASPLTTKGDVFTYSTDDDRLAVGTNGQYLVADSAEATGLKWVTRNYDSFSPNTTKGDITVRNASTNTRLPVGSDGQTIIADSTASEGVKWGTVQGVKNYILNPGAESALTGWATYLDNSASARPVDGTGGSPATVLTRSTSLPLSGAASFVWTKSAADRRGEGFSYDFSIDLADRAKVLNISFDWAISSGTYSGGSPTTDSDMIAYIYDVTNGVLIEPAPIKLDGGVVDVNYKFVASFQSSSNSTSYRLILHTATTSASAYTLQFDGFTVSPSVVTTGAFVSDSTDYTATAAGFGSVTSASYKQLRKGDKLRVEGSFTTGTVAGTTASVTLPAGLNISSTKLAGTTAIVGEYATVKTAGTGRVLAIPGTSTTTVFFGPNEGSTNNLTSNTGTNVSANTAAFSFWFEVPIAGWGTSQSLSSETDTRVVVMRTAASVPTGTIATSFGSSTNINFGSTASVFDSHAAYASGVYTVPIAGFYSVAGQVVITGTETINNYLQLGVMKNGSLQQVGAKRLQAAAITDNPVSCNVVVQCNSGDTLSLRCITDIATPGFASDSTANFFQVQRISGPSQIAASEDVLASVHSASTTIGTSGTTIIFSAKAYDSHGSYNTTTGEFTVPVSGKYAVEAYTEANGSGPSSSSTNRVVYMNVSKNGVLERRLDAFNFQVASVALAPYLSGSATVNCVAGDRLTITMTRPADIGSYSLNSSPSATHAMFTKVGN